MIEEIEEQIKTLNQSRLETISELTRLAENRLRLEGALIALSQLKEKSSPESDKPNDSELTESS